VQHLTKIDFITEGFGGDEWLQSQATFDIISLELFNCWTQRMVVNVFGKPVCSVERFVKDLDPPSHYGPSAYGPSTYGRSEIYLVGGIMQIVCASDVTVGDGLWALHGCSYLVVLRDDVEATNRSGKNCAHLISAAVPARPLNKNESWDPSAALKLLAAAVLRLL
jgi:hypothetical protein